MSLGKRVNVVAREYLSETKREILDSIRPHGRKTKNRAPRQLQAGSCDDGLDGLGNNRRHPRRDEMLSRSR